MTDFIQNEIARLHAVKAPIEAENDSKRKKWMGRWPLDHKLKVAMIEAQRAYEAAVVAYHESVAATNAIMASDNSIHPDYSKIIHDLNWLKNVKATVDGDVIDFMESQPQNLSGDWDSVRKVHVNIPSKDEYELFLKAQTLRELKVRLEAYGYVFEDIVRA